MMKPLTRAELNRQSLARRLNVPVEDIEVSADSDTMFGFDGCHIFFKERLACPEVLVNDNEWLQVRCLSEFKTLKSLLVATGSCTVKPEVANA